MLDHVPEDRPPADLHERLGDDACAPGAACRARRRGSRRRWHLWAARSRWRFRGGSMHRGRWHRPTDHESAPSRYWLHEDGSPVWKPVLQASLRCSGVPWWLGLAASKSPTASAASRASCTSPSSSRFPHRRSWPTCRRSNRPGVRRSPSRDRPAVRPARPGPDGRTRARRCRRPRSESIVLP